MAGDTLEGRGSRENARLVLDAMLLALPGVLLFGLMWDTVLAMGSDDFSSIGVSLYALVAMSLPTVLVVTLLLRVLGISPVSTLMRLREWGERPTAPATLLAVWGAALVVLVFVVLLHLSVANLFLTGFKNKDLSGYMLNFFEYAAAIGVVLGSIALARLSGPPIRWCDRRLAGSIPAGRRSLTYASLLGLLTLGLVAWGLRRALTSLSPLTSHMILMGMGLLLIVLVAGAVAYYVCERLQGRVKLRWGLRLVSTLVLLVSLVLGGLAASDGDAVRSAVNERPAAAIGALWLPMAESPTPPIQPPTHRRVPVRPSKNTR